jgi:hypothetical protein
LYHGCGGCKGAKLDFGDQNLIVAIEIWIIILNKIMRTFRKFIEKRFLIEQGIGAPGAIPGGPPGGGGPPPMGGGPMGGPPPMGGGMGGPPPGLGGPPGGPPMGGGGPGGDMSGKKPLELKPLDVWEVLERLLGLDKEETPKKPPQPKQNQHLQS